MAAQRPKLGSYLEWHNGSIRVAVAVPRRLRGTLPTYLKRSLRTDSPANAERIKHRVIQELKDQIAAAERAAAPTVSGLTGEALQWREEIERSPDADTLETLVHDRAEELERSDGFEAAKAFYDVATGKATPVDASAETYLAESGLRERSKGELRRALRVYREWCEASSTPFIVEAATRRVAGRFLSERLLPTIARKTVEKYLSFLSGYWKWMEAKGLAADVPWSGQLTRVGLGRTRRAPAESLGETGATGKRPYSAAEASALLYSPAPGTTGQRTTDIAWLGALSGMRLDEICRLRIGDCRDGWFAVNAQEAGKTAAGVRRVPIHSALVPIVERLSRGRDCKAYLIADLPAEGRERSMPASKAYTRFRRSLGIDERGEGQRQSNVDFHSWRRWFIREAREGGASLWTIADIVGHDTASLPGGLTMSHYPGNASDRALVACVESIPVPQPPQSGITGLG